MARQYKIVELNTAVKPFYFRYLFDSFADAESIIYLDPDIFIYNSFEYVENCLQVNDIILTPHACSPVPLDNKKPGERSYLKYGIFNLGFLAVTRSENTDIFLKWLADRLYDYCYMEVNLGMYVDQLWINHVPVYFSKVCISKHMGLNCAYWNLHERYFSFANNSYFINKTFQLLFFHFSALDVYNTNITSLEPIRNIHKIFHLNIDHNKITTLEPIRNLVFIAELTMSSTSIPDLADLSNFSFLREFECSDNPQIKSLGPVNKFENVKILKIVHTGISKEEAARFKKNHPDCQITFY